MPAYNEEACIEQVCLDWLKILDPFDGGRLIVIDDGSRDKTGAILDRLAERESRLLVLHQPNGGHGTALLAGYRKAIELGCKAIFQVDSDNQFQADDFHILWSLRASSHFILGCREKRRDAPIRLVISKIARLLNLILFGADIRDANIPFRLIRADFLERLLAELPQDLFAPNIALSILAQRAGQTLHSAPVRHQDRAAGTGGLRGLRLLRACARCLRETLALRLRFGAILSRLRAP